MSMPWQAKVLQLQLESARAETARAQSKLTELQELESEQMREVGTSAAHVICA